MKNCLLQKAPFVERCPQSAVKKRLLIWPFLCLAALPPVTCSASAAETVIPTNSSSMSPELLARAACSACHLFPDPRLLDKTIWPAHIFPKMRLYMGLDKPDPTASKDVEPLQKAGFFPAAPMIPESSWERITNWFMSKAPEPTNTPSRNDSIPITLTDFKVVVPKDRHSPPLTTLVQIDPQEHLVFFCDAGGQALEVLNDKAERVTTILVGNIVTSLQHNKDGFYLGCIGHFFPTEDKRGQVIFLKQLENGLERRVLLSELPRVSHIELGDFNKDGRTDFALCMFGFLTGRFSWFENMGDDKFTEHVLFNKPGAVKSVAYDFNKDGNMDLAVLFGQETDGMLMFLNDGKGGFTQKEIFRRAPVWGHSYFELADFNGDGEMEFLVTNGDNGDYESPPRPYHGVRIFSKKGERYEESFFYPLHGAYKAVARDFDGDGDLDIAALSFFPDYQSSPRESFVYLENKGKMKFEPSTFRECIAGRWLTMDAADLDGDGRIDIVLGSLIQMPTVVPPFLKEMWEKQSPSVLYLLNQHKQP